MPGVSENGLLSKQEFAEYKTQSVRAKSMNQIFLGIGGATVFGIVAAVTKSLLDVAATNFALTATGILPVAGIVAIGVVGIASLYIGANYVARSIMLDQDFQARKIAAAARGVVPIVEQPIHTPTTQVAMD